MAPCELRVTLTTRYSSGNCAEFLGLCFLGELDPMLPVGGLAERAEALTDFLVALLGDPEREFEAFGLDWDNEHILEWASRSWTLHGKDKGRI